MQPVVSNETMRLRLLVLSQQTVEFAENQQWQAMEEAERALANYLQAYITRMGAEQVAQDNALAESLLQNQQSAVTLLVKAQNQLARDFKQNNQQLRATQQYLNHAKS